MIRKLAITVTPPVETIIEITGKQSSWNNRVIVIEDKIKSISKKDEFDNISVDNKRILKAIHLIKKPGRYLMNLF